MIKDTLFYKTVIRIMIPLALQNLLSFCVQMLDTVMVGALGDIAVSAVSLANQPYFIFQVIIFGLASGGSVLISQYWGKKDKEAICQVISIMLWMITIASVVYSILCLLFPVQIIRIFSKEEALIMMSADYLKVVVFSYLLNGLSNCYLSALQSKEDIKMPTIIYTISFFVNFICNATLIFGLFGFPKLGVVGAAIGTVIARGFEAVAALVYATYFEKDIQFRFRHLFKINKQLIPSYISTSLPVIGNDIVWSLGSSARMAIMGNIGSTFVTAVSIAGIAEQFGMIFLYGVAKAASIMVGKEIGSRNIEYAKKMGRTFLIMGAGFGLLGCITILLIRTPLLMLYPNITLESHEMAYSIMTVIGYIMIVTGVECLSILGILRGSGDTKFAFAVDGGCMWFIGIPLGFIAAFIWKLPAPLIYLCLRIDVVVKIMICSYRIFKGNYIKDVTIK